MTDRTELKRAAAAASQGRWNQDGFDVQNDDIEDYRVCRCNLLADAKFIAAANPAAVLALIAENECQATQFKKWQAGHHANYCQVAEERDQLKAENEALRKAALAAREFIMHEAEVRGLLDESNEVSFRHPRRQAAIATIDAAMGNGSQS